MTFAVVVSILLSGCPGMNIPGLTNSITLVHDYQGDGPVHQITAFGVSKVVCGDAVPVPANVLPESVDIGGEYTIGGLSDGEYIINYVLGSGGGSADRKFRQTIEGGVNFKIYYRI